MKTMIKERYLIELESKEELEALENILERAQSLEPLVMDRGCCNHCVDFVCPTCYNEDLYEGQNFCDECGQGLDWECDECDDLDEALNQMAEIVLNDSNINELAEFVKSLMK